MQALLHDDTDESVKLRKKHEIEGLVLSKLAACSEVLRCAAAQLASLNRKCPQALCIRQQISFAG